MIYNIDCLKHLASSNHYRTIIADIPDNIGLEYNGFVDKRKDYYPWVSQIVQAALVKSDIFVFTYNAIHDNEIGAILRNVKRVQQKVIWTFTFGQYNDEGFTPSWRPIVIIGDDLNYDGIRTVSARMALGDSRAKGLRVPGNVWEYPRVVGNAAERRSWHPTQLPEALVHRLMVLCCTRTIKGKTEPYGDCCDIFLGSGTTGIVCEKLGIDYDGCEISTAYYNELTRFLGKNL